jgi:tartrate dehydrogenase/decarboxylase/D-malate dehydrogenase
MTATNRSYRIAVITGDGIGKEVVPEGVRVLEAAAKRHGFRIEQDWFDFSSYDYYERHGRMLPEDWRERIGGHDAIFFGAVGWPRRSRTTSRSGAPCCSSAGPSTST